MSVTVGKWVPYRLTSLVNIDLGSGPDAEGVSKILEDGDLTLRGDLHGLE